MTIKQHSVRLQNYGFFDWLSVMPPFNYEHYIINDVQTTHTGRLMGDAFGLVPPILQNPAWVPYTAYRPGGMGPVYSHRQAMRALYVKEEANPQYSGQLLQVYDEGDDGSESWRVQGWNTTPFNFTEFLLPDIPGYSDLYLFTSAFTAPQSDNHRVKLWFDPATSGAKYKSSAWLRNLRPGQRRRR